mgnify:CR=1 FL=1|tara:strand:+ start:30 stop:743 length:714 start_codon:yes stop_codon:yes gene_type:complete
MGIGKKLTKGMIGGGVNIAHKSKMSNAAKNQMNFDNGMPGPNKSGQTQNNIMGRGMAQYIAGENVSIGMRMGKPHGGPEKGKVHKNSPYKLGDLSVDAGIDNNPEVTRADIITGAKKNKPGGATKSGGPGNFGSGFGVSTTGNDKKKKENSSMSDAEKIKASKTKKEAAGNKKKAEGQADLKTAKEMKFISRGSGEDSGIATREERRKAIRAARAKKRAGRKEARKARKKTVIKQKI